MSEHFEKAPAELRQRVLDASLEEFSAHGYQQTSTNAIVRRAQIPKGTLFYFFGSKKDLYLYLVAWAVERYARAMEAMRQQSPPPDDFFERLMDQGKKRMQFAVQEPRLYQLLYHAFVTAPEDVRAELWSIYNEAGLAGAQANLAGVRSDSFREEVNLKQATELVYLVMDGVFRKYLERLKKLSPEESLRLIAEVEVEAREKFELLKWGLYRPVDEE